MSKVRTTPIHPGEVLHEVFVKPAWPPLTVAQLAKRIHIPRQHITSLIEGQRAITRDIAKRLGAICTTTPKYWMSLQRTYDLQIKKRNPACAGRRLRHHRSGTRSVAA